MSMKGAIVLMGILLFCCICLADELQDKVQDDVENMPSGLEQLKTVEKYLAAQSYDEALVELEDIARSHPEMQRICILCRDRINNLQVEWEMKSAIRDIANGKHRKALEKCERILEEHPNASLARVAKKIASSMVVYTPEQTSKELERESCQHDKVKLFRLRECGSPLYLDAIDHYLIALKHEEKLRVAKNKNERLGIMNKVIEYRNRGTREKEDIDAWLKNTEKREEQRKEIKSGLRGTIGK